MLKLWIFQAGEPLHCDAGNRRPMRAMNLANMALARGHQVVVWSADFDHIEKRFRQRHEQPIQVEPDLEIRLLPSTGYRRNIGPARLLDHAVLGYRLNRCLAAEKQLPDVVFVGYPPIETAYVLTRWCRRRGVPVLLDVKDQWPVIFSNALPPLLRPAGRVLLYPYSFLARRAMRSASALSAMADSFLDWALSYCGRERNADDAVFPLTTPAGQQTPEAQKNAEQWWDENGLPDDGRGRICFVGSFSPAFDFEPLAKAARLMMQRGENFQFVLCGDGGAVDEVKRLMSGLDNVIFPRWLDRPKIEVLAQRCIASVAPYKNTPDFMRSIPNKVIDSMSLGLPLLTPLKGEVRELLDRYEVGLSYDDDAQTADASLYDSVKSLGENKMMQNTMSAAATDLYNARFSYEQVYGGLVHHLEKLAGQTG